MEIEHRTILGYDPTSRLITDLAQLAEKMARFEESSRRLDDIGEQHARRAGFLERLADW